MWIKKSTTVFIHESKSENVGRQVTSILSLRQCVKKTFIWALVLERTHCADQSEQAFVFQSPKWLAVWISYTFDVYPFWYICSQWPHRLTSPAGWYSSTCRVLISCILHMTQQDVVKSVTFHKPLVTPLCLAVRSACVEVVISECRHFSLLSNIQPCLCRQWRQRSYDFRFSVQWVSPFNED